MQPLHFQQTCKKGVNPYERNPNVSALQGAGARGRCRARGGNQFRCFHHGHGRLGGSAFIVNNISFCYTVYMHVNSINGKRYIGITKQKPEYRWRSDGSGYFRSPHFWGAIQKYGWNNFKHIILLENADRNFACEMEQELIDLYRTRDRRYGYNMTAGGDGSRGWKPSAETLAKRSAKLRGIKRSEQHRQRLREANLGKKATKETREKLRESHIGKKLKGHALEVARMNMAEANKKRKKSVYCIDQEGRRRDFESINAAAAFYHEPILTKNFKVIAESGRIVNGRQWYYKEAS